MNVFIITEGFKDTGFGHITRCISLYQAFEEKGFNPFLIVNGDSKVKKFLQDFNFKIFDWISESKRLQKIISGVKIVVVDSYLAPISFYKMISATPKFLVFLDDNIRLNYPSYIVVNGTLYAEDFNYPKNKNIYLLGTKYIPLRKEFCDISAKRINKKIKSILITMGGQDIRNLTPLFLKFVTENYPRLEKRVVISQGFDNISEIRKTADDRTILIRNADAAKMRELMLSSDLAVSAGGQTLYELARTGLPTLAVCVAENQKKNIENWKQAGFIGQIGWWDDKNLLKNLKKNLTEVEDYNVRKEMSAKGKSLVDGLGSKRIVEKIVEKVSKSEGFYLKRATLSDIKDVYRLSNEKVVRNNSINKNKIRWNDHIEWYNKKINQSDYDFLVAYNNSDFIGIIRFEISPSKTLISISLSKSYRGKGLGSKIISNASEYVFYNRKNIKKILAYIKPDNKFSINAFVKAGYKFSKSLNINEIKFNLYIISRKKNI